MTDKYLKQFFILNLIFSVLLVAMIFIYGVVAGLGLPLGIIFSGFVTSFFIKENNLLFYAKGAVLISSIFSVLLIAGIGVSLYSVEEKFWLGHDIFELVTIFIISFAFLSFLNLVGALLGIIPKAMAERISLRSQ